MLPLLRDIQSMDTTPIDLSHLFAQLGLENNQQAIDSFIASHSIADDIVISQAHFWTSSQRAFLIEALEDDANWSDLIDHLDTLLRKE